MFDLLMPGADVQPGVQAGENNARCGLDSAAPWRRMSYSVMATAVVGGISGSYPGGAMRPRPLIAVADVEATSRWAAHGHPHLGSEDTVPHGNGVVLWCQSEDFDAALERVGASKAEVLEGPMRIIGKSGYAIRMATRWCWREPMAMFDFRYGPSCRVREGRDQ